MENNWIVLRLAWRNVWRNKRRTALTLLTIAVGSAMIVFINSLNAGAHEQMIEDSIRLSAGHLQLQDKEFLENVSIENAFVPGDRLLRFLERDKRILGYCRRIHTDALVSFKGTTLGVMVQGLEPEREKAVTNIHTTVLKGGRFFKTEDADSIILGETLAKNLGATLNDTVAVISQGFDGSIAAGKFRIVGIMKTNDMEYDQFLLLLPFDRASEFFSMMGYINTIAVRLTSFADVDDVMDAVRGEAGDPAVSVVSWERLIPELVQYITIDDIQGYIFDFILFMIVAFGIMNTMQMSVFERIREFGIMLAIGTRPSQLFSVILVESCIIAVLGIVAGDLFGCGLSYYFKLNPLDFSQYAAEMSTLGSISVILPAKTNAANVLATTLLIMVITVLFSYYPARRAAGLKPLEAIRHL